MKRTFLLFLAFLLMGAAQAQTLRPRIALVSPSGGQRGTTVTVTLTGVNLDFGTQLLFEGTGLSMEQFSPDAPPPNAKNADGRIVARIKIAPEASLGRHPLRVITALGTSDVGYLVVGEWPEIAEKEPNDTREQAQVLTGPVTVNGRSDGPEDVDQYRVTIQKGETVVFAAAAGSIGSPLIPVLNLRDSLGKDVGFAAALNQPDAVLTFTAPQTGDYYLSLHDLRYQGGAPFYYRLTVGKIPIISSVFPMGGSLGTTTRLALIGENLTTPAQRDITLPREMPSAPLTLPEIGAPLLEVGDGPEVMEVEKNDLPETAQRVTIPVTINGRIYAPYSPLPDVDCFRFSATKGEVLQLEVVAARLGSPLDGVLDILDAKGKTLATNDDAHGKDPALTFTVPETGEYIARVSDLTGRSGEAFGYRLHIGPVRPDFTLAFTPDCLSVAPGDRIPVTITAARQNGFDAEIPLSLEGTPAGMHWIGTPVIAKGQSSVTLFATADPSTPSLVTPFHVTGTATIAGKPVIRHAESLEQNYIKEGDQVKPITHPVPFGLVAITGPADLNLTTTIQKVSLTAGKTAVLKVTVQRKADFTAKIPIIVQGLPTGVSVTGNEIAEKANEATLTFKAEGNAATGDFTLTLLGRSVVDELRFTDHAALPVTLTVAPPAK
jgi:hypothetical protein